MAGFYGSAAGLPGPSACNYGVSMRDDDLPPRGMVQRNRHLTLTPNRPPPMIRILRSSLRRVSRSCQVARSRSAARAVVSLLGLFLLAAPPLVYAQETAPPDSVYRVETRGGDVIVGTLVSETGTEVVIDARGLGRVTIDRDNIKSMNAIDPARIRDGQYWFQNPQSSRYFFAPNAIGIPEGQGYYQNTWVLFNNVNYGVSDNFSIGAGTVPVFLFGADIFPIWFLPKLSVSVPQSNLHFAGGAVLGGVLGAEGTGGVGLVYGASTIGTRDHNATLGIGYDYAGGGFAVNVSGMTRIGRTTYLITENYYSPAWEGGVLSVGIRWAPENFAVDFALFRPLEEAGSFIGAPWLGVTIPFGG